jgi:hypothetical protein
MKNDNFSFLRAVIIAVLVVIGLFGASIGIVWLDLPPREVLKSRSFTIDLISDFETDTKISTSGGYQDGQAEINVYGVHDADQQVSIKARFVRMLAERQEKRPESLKSVRLRFCRETKEDDKPYAEFVIPAGNP